MRPLRAEVKESTRCLSCSPLPLRERVATSREARRSRVRGLFEGLSKLPPHPPRFARHPLPQGEREKKIIPAAHRRPSLAHHNQANKNLDKPEGSGAPKGASYNEPRAIGARQRALSEPARLPALRAASATCGRPSTALAPQFGSGCLREQRPSDEQGNATRNIIGDAPQARYPHRRQESFQWSLKYLLTAADISVTVEIWKKSTQ